jgi:YHS domain-containing protein
MVRTVLIILLAIILISLLRGVIGIVGKAVGNLAQGNPPARRPGAPPTADELKRDPVCGLYVPAATAVKRTVRGELMHFCSESCAGKYVA